MWNEATVRRLIARKTYYGSMRGNPNMKFEALISVELHTQANLAVDSRFKRGRGTVKVSRRSLDRTVVPAMAKSGKVHPRACHLCTQLTPAGNTPTTRARGMVLRVSRAVPLLSL